MCIRDSWTGVGFRNHEKKQSFNISSIPSLLDFELVGGIRLGPYVSYFKRWESGRMINLFSNVNIGIKNQDLQGSVGGWFFYNAHRQAAISFNTGRGFYAINNFDAYLNQLRVSNYILHDYGAVDHNFEIVNGLYFYTHLGYSNRQSISDFETATIIDSLFTDEVQPLEFEDYQALTTTFRLSYTPRQKYMTEPNRKVVLGSKFPTFSIQYRKGWNNLLESDIDFDYVEFSVSQDVILGFFGNSKYNVRTVSYTHLRAHGDAMLSRMPSSA